MEKIANKQFLFISIEENDGKKQAQKEWFKIHQMKK
jgi:hypothetical protein